MQDKNENRETKTSALTPTRRGFLKGVTAAAIGGAATGIGGPVASASACFGDKWGFGNWWQPQDYRTSWEPACIGGPVPPRNSNHAIIRWLGTVNFEICYRGQIFLFDNYYDIVPESIYGTWRCPELGFRAEDVTRATAIFVGHAHYDHMADTAQVALQTGAPVYGDQIVADTLIEQGVPEDQITVIGNGDVFNYRDLTVEAVHIYHSSYSPTGDGPGRTIMPDDDSSSELDGIKDEFNSLTNAEWGYPPLTDEEEAFIDATKARGSFDSKIKAEGTFGYLFTFANRLTAFLYDSHNPELSPAFEALMDRIGSVDIGTVGFQGGTAEHLSEYVWPVVEAYKAKYLWPCHNDTTPGYRLQASPQHLALLAKETFPDRHTIIPLYREPVCFDVKKRKRVSLDMD